MRDPFKIDFPTCVSFSGGRTSAYMLWRVLQANQGLPEEAIVQFANTGKEREETLRFVHDCSVIWNVPIVWLEYRREKPKFVQVDFATASREGEPFEALIRERSYLPNPVSRFCTAELKIRTAHRYLLSRGLTEWDTMVGIRADEPLRFAKLMGRKDAGPRETKSAPLYHANVTKEDVGTFWRQSHFDLMLPNMNGTTPWGNCDLCFLKGARKVRALVGEEPERAVWWARMEQQTKGEKPTGCLWRSDRTSYTDMLKHARDAVPNYGNDDDGDPDVACFCGE